MVLIGIYLKHSDRCQCIRFVYIGHVHRFKKQMKWEERSEKEKELNVDMHTHVYLKIL
jgi:hypothetical protein